ncbi:MAG TPA: hypothetical protein VF062_14550 [Candidatus Limnocylindrales bacterium]
MPRLYVDNVVRMWTAYGDVASPARDHVHFKNPKRDRIVLTDPRDDVEDLISGRGVLTLEDSFGTSKARDRDGMLIKRMPIMDRPPGPIAVTTPTGTTVCAVKDAGELGDAERVIVDGFPQRANQPWRPGVALPSHRLDVPGWTVWLRLR